MELFGGCFTAFTMILPHIAFVTVPWPPWNVGFRGARRGDRHLAGFGERGGPEEQQYSSAATRGRPSQGRVGPFPGFGHILLEDSLPPVLRDGLQYRHLHFHLRGQVIAQGCPAFNAGLLPGWGWGWGSICESQVYLQNSAVMEKSLD